MPQFSFRVDLAFYARFFALLALLLCLGMRADAQANEATAVDIKLPGHATVKSDTLVVYSEMSHSSETVKTLKKGDALVYGFEIQIHNDDWCKVREAGSSEWIGFVDCEQLDRVKPPSFASFSTIVLRGAPSARPGAGQSATGANANAVAAPDFTLEDLSGNLVTLSSMKGRPVLLDFWASWCGPCRAEMPVIERLHRDYAQRGLVVIGVDVGEPRDKVARFIEREGYSYTVVLDRDLEAAMLYDARALPTLVVIDGDGNVTAYGHGTRSEAELRANIRRAGLR
jgi:thiol-disulfide isomerase/thioredoxin